ncbi:MAG: hypothetical protein M2R45_02697 [Verrucomicrobia subdivision 3 bacterium]|nr:hypothetical protein [Limisphaerales bacterium]MCS1415039.1 hypothetical protein [Limisphaerales bacterium]
MNNGILLFFGVLLAMISSWFGFVHSPQVQFGSQLPELDEVTNRTFPVPRSGAAERGRDVYRQNGCASCHTQQVRQEGYNFSVEVVDFGTNALQVPRLLPSMMSQYSAGQELPATPFEVNSGLTLRVAERFVRRLSDAGADAMLVFNPVGADIARGWGVRRTVGRDYLLDQPVMLGSQRIGPDLSNIGNRRSDVNWHLVHLFQPRKVVEDSVMPSYAYLFEKREVRGEGDPGALRYEGQLVTDNQGRQVMPRAAAKDLVAYLMSLRLDEPIFEAPGLVLESAEAMEVQNSERKVAESQ